MRMGLCGLILILPLIFLVSSAQSEPGYCSVPEPGDVGIYGDAAGTMSTMSVAGFAPFNLYVVAFEPPEGLQGFQFGITGTETFTHLSAELLGGLIDPTPVESREWIVALADCYDAATLVLLKLNLGYFAGPVAPYDNSVCIGASSAAPIVGRPTYQNCAGTDVGFGLSQDGEGRYADGCFIMNPTIIICPTEEGTFGGLKARFGSK